MKTIAGGRQTGKTMELIKLSAEGWYYIVCHSRQEAHRVYGKAIEMGLDIPLPITYDEFLGRQYHSRGVRGFLIDNADMLLSRLSSVPIIAFTATVEKQFRVEEVSDEGSD